MNIDIKKNIMNKNSSINKSRRILLSSTKFIDNDFNIDIHSLTIKSSSLGEGVSPFILNIFRRNKDAKNIIQESEALF